MKVNNVIYLVIGIVGIMIVGIIGIVVLKNNSKIEHYEVSQELKDVDINDEIVQRGFNMINIDYFENININVIDLLYSGNEVKVSDLSDEQKMFLVLNYYTNIHDYYMCSDNYVVKDKDLEKLYFEDATFLDRYKSTNEVGYFSIKYNDGYLIETNGCYGAEGPTSMYKIKLDSAKKSDTKLLVNVRMAYLHQSIDTFDEDKETFYMIGYDNLEAKGDKVQDKIYSDEEIAWDKYPVYQFEFKIDLNNLYFNKVSKILGN